MKHSSFMISLIVSTVLAMSCSVDYVVKPKDDKIDPKSTSFLELCEQINEQWADAQEISRVYICSHRANTYESFRQGIPDNSIPNIKQAIKAGVDMVELDVRTTKDGELVLMHNATIDETTTGYGAVSSLTLEQIQSYDMKKAGKVYKDNHGNTTHVPTLKEALEACKDKVYVNLDLAGKDNNPVQIMSVIYEVGVEEQVVLYASGEIPEYVKLNPLIAVHPYISSSDDIDKYSSTIGAKMFQYSNATYLNGNAGEFVLKSHLKGAVLFSNLLDTYDNQIRDDGDYSSLDKFIASGTDFVQTDVCELVDNYLKTKGLR